MSRLQEFLTTPIGSAFRVFLGVTLGYLVLDLQADGTVSISLSEIWTWVAAALVIVVPITIAALNPQDTRFGRTA